MELPEPRPYGNGGTGRRPTHDFLSLYTPQDPTPSSQGGYLKTHDFLQPLERVGKTRAKEETIVVEKPSAPSVEHILPGGIGTYSISHISYFDQRVAKQEGTMFTATQASSTERNDDNSNCSSYTGSGFTIREESAVKKGKTGKENIAQRPAGRDIPVKLGQWMPERQSVSSSSNHRNSFSSLSSSQKNHSFMEMIKSAKDNTQEDDIDDDDEFVLKKEPSSSHKGELSVKVDGKRTDQKANTPRSKHSATEQRRRSKINDRFHMLRELIPHSDQKRDKASFLLEVIEYIQYLQEKVHKYEGSYKGWHNEPENLTPWRNHRPAESFADQSRGLNSGSGPALVFDAKFEEKNITVGHAIPVESDMSTATTFKAMDHHPGMENKGLPFPVSLQPKIFTSVRSGGIVAQPPPRKAENLASQPQPQLGQARSCANESAGSEKLKERDLTIERGTISISSVYSQGLLNTLTQALESSGVDLSQANISVQIDLGKHADSRLTSVKTMIKDNDVSFRNQGATHPRVARSDDSGQVLKRLKTGRS